jgi:hypothetical protein
MEAVMPLVVVISLQVFDWNSPIKRSMVSNARAWRRHFSRIWNLAMRYF